MSKVQEIVSRKKYDMLDTRVKEAYELGAEKIFANDVLLSEPGWTLFELNFKNNEITFIDVGENANMFLAPFSYFSQTDSAKRLAVLSLQEFLDVTAALPVPENLIHIYNPGHCGSTLLHNIFNESGEAWSLSEPHFGFDVCVYADALPSSLRVKIMQACLKCISYFPHARDRRFLVLKHFSQSTKYYEEWQQAHPSTTNLYLHRNAVDWCNSVYGFVQREGLPTPMPLEMRQFVWWIMTGGLPESLARDLTDFDGGDLKFVDIAAAAWGIHTQQFHRARSSGMKFITTDYIELNTNRRETVVRLLEACGLPSSCADQALKAFNRDSHEGTRTSHEKAVELMSDEARQRVRKILSNSRLAIDPDIRL